MATSRPSAHPGGGCDPVEASLPLPTPFQTARLFGRVGRNIPLLAQDDFGCLRGTPFLLSPFGVPENGWHVSGLLSRICEFHCQQSGVPGLALPWLRT